jgi:hypothetical protein
MPRINVPPHIKVQRYSSCMNCKYFVKSTRSCGTLILGGSVDEEDQEDQIITHRKKKIKLCGCVMPLKTKFAFSSCPIGKWDTYGLKKEEIVELRSFVESLPTKGRITNDQIDMMYAWMNKMIGVKQKRCSSCIKQMIIDLKTEIKFIDHE